MKLKFLIIKSRIVLIPSYTFAAFHDVDLGSILT